ncbi:predicted protein [Postia placenta Mad-698-R]|nr:predicted protein [Postia placenta Mad-698-R]
MGGRRGSMQQEPSPRIREDKYHPLKCRAAEASLYTGKDKGRLCALVRAQLVHAQHADAAQGAEYSRDAHHPTFGKGKAAEAGLYTGEDKGRLCALVRAQLVHAQLVHAQLVRAQLVHAQHADAALGARK